MSVSGQKKSGSRNCHYGSVSGPRNWQKTSVSGSRNWHFLSVSFLDPETDNMDQFLGPETDIMGEGNFMGVLSLLCIFCMKHTKYWLTEYVLYNVLSNKLYHEGCWQNILAMQRVNEGNINLRNCTNIWVNIPSAYHKGLWVTDWTAMSRTARNLHRLLH